ncbi:tenascin-N isoform X2 [Polyodon spathula]|uniref:tenascin-N isoform X2 n=1 Tax=Polyodon spathula TaxID=7913 RepID=UPI001B7ED32A|nr:tenascin-N isoform X2 [Polyodon spathula]
MTLSIRPLLLLGALCVCTADKPAPDQTGDHEITFRHIYNIDQPKSSDCKLELDSLPANGEGTELVATPVSLNADNNMVFKHNIRLQTPKCDCGASEAFKSMLFKLNRLEEEVTYLKDQCSQGCCGGGAGLASLCSGHGSFKRDTCSCDCHEGWEGEDCSTRSCPNECSDNGRCVDGKCVCYEGYIGVDCSEQLCLNDCSDKGRCVDGMCQCFSGFTGEDCSQRTCLNDCSSNGECDDGVCICEEGFFGDNCSQVLGPKEFHLVKASEESLLVSWDYVPGAEYYLLTYYPEGAEGKIKQIKVPKTKNSHLITGLTSGVIYIINLYTFIKYISSEPSNLVASTVVSSIDSVNVVSQMEDSIHVEWKNPPTEVDFFKLTVVNPEGQENEIRVQKAKGAKTSYIIRDLQPGTLYLIKVQAVKEDIEGKPFSVNGVTEIDAPSNLVTKSVTEDTATLTWNRVQALIDGYRISYTSADGQSQEISVVADRNSHKLTGLRPGVEYTVYIWAMKGNRSSKKTSTKAITEIDAPTNLVTKSVTEDTATLTWNRVQALIDGYRISYTSADGQSQEISVGADRNSHKLTGLRPGVEYTVYIWAMKGNRSSKKTSTKAVTEIDAPTNLRVTDVKQASGVVMWTLPQAVISGYILTYKRADGKGQEKEKTLSSADESYLLGGLEQGVHYIVRLVAFRGVMRSKTVETTFTTVGDLFPFPMDCTQAMKNGNTLNGIYTIYLNSDRSQPMKVYCDMTTDGGGWIVIQRRNSGKIDFLKRWKNYTQGFGDMNEEFWLGLDKMYDLTNSQQYELRVDLRAGSESAYAIYDNFKLAPATEKYKLTIGNYRGTAGDAMTYHQGRAFTTVDRDNDIALSNCAFTHHGAWWYRNCHLANLNGQYGQTTHSVGVNWEPWKGHEFSIPFVEMKIRPRSENPVPGRMKKSLSGRGKRKTE